MDLVEAMRGRKSIRGYKPKPVSKDTLRQVIELAIQSPSTYNTQPWQVYIITGEPMVKIREANIEMETSGVESYPEVPRWPYDGKYKQRQVDAAKQVYQRLGIARENKEGRADWQQKSSRFYDAPAAVIVCTDRALQGQLTLMDIGGFMNALCLAAWNFGLGTCIQLRPIGYPDIVRKYTRMPESTRMLMAIAIGYPDDNFPANKVETEREPADNVITWCGFD